MFEALVQAGQSYLIHDLQEEIQLARVIHDPTTTADAKARAVRHLVLGNIAFAIYYVDHLVPHTHPNYEDMLAKTLLGMVKAAWRYQPERDEQRQPARFVTYARFWLRQTLMESYQDARGATIPAQKRALIARYYEWCEAFFIRELREPTPDEIAEGLDIDPTTYNLLMTLIQTPISLSRDDLTLDQIPDSTASHDMEDRLDAINRQQMADLALNALEPRERRLWQVSLGMLDGVERTDEETAREFGIVRQRVTAIRQQSLDIMRAVFANQLRD